MTWDYAELSKAAKAAGGPEKLIDLIRDNAKHIGRIEGRSSMAPWLILAVVASVGITYGATKLIEHHKNKKAALQQAVEKAGSELIHNLNEYDSMHTDENHSTEEGEDDHGQER